MPAARHTFSHLDTDTDKSALPGNAFDSALNIALNPGFITAATGNVLVPYALPPVVSNARLGGFEDGSTGTAISLLHNGGGLHRILRYDPMGNGGAGSETTLLEWSGLNLSPTLVPQGGVLDGILVFLDALGDVRSVDLKRAAAGEYTPAVLAADPYILHVLKQPAFQMLTPSRQNDPTVVGNQIAFKAFQFALRYVYADGGRSTVSAVSPVIYPLSSATAGIDPLNYIYIPLYSLIKVSSLTSMEILVREGNAASWNIATRIRPDATGTWPIYFSFTGDTIGEAITDAEAAKTFESLWPAKALTIAHSRVFVGQLTEGYPRGGTTSFAAVLVNQDQCDVSTAIAPVKTFHELSSYQVGLQYYDQFRRPGGVVSEVTIAIPAQPVTLTSALSLMDNQVSYIRKTIAWSVNNNTPSEIPAWAKYFSVCASPNSRCSAFTQRLNVFVAGFYGDRLDGTPNLSNNTNFTSEVNEKALWVQVDNNKTILDTGAYVFQLGDILRFMDEVGQEWPILYARSVTTVDGTFYYVAIARRVGSVQKDSYGNNFGFLGRIEIYSPNKITTSGRLVYEQTDLIPITSTTVGGVTQSQYSFTYGTLQGDAYIVRSDYSTGAYVDKSLTSKARKIYLIESTTPLAPLTAALGPWLDMQRGTPAFVLAPELGQTKRKSLIRFSGVKVQGTLLNGLGQWEVLSQYDDLPQEQGAITRLIVADQTQTDGSILLVTQERGTNSLALSRSQIQAADGAVLLAISKQVIGGSNTLRGGYGCTDTASVVAHAGKVFFWCAYRAEVLRYDRNGLTPLGLTYKVRTRLEAASRLYASARITACFDPSRKEYILVFGATDTLPGLTLVYSDRYEAWSDELSMRPEAGLAVGNELISYQGGATWRHTADAPQATFYGVYTAPQLTFTVAQPGGVAKQFKDIAVESGSLWLATKLTTDTKLVSRTLSPWFTLREGVYRAGLRRAENTAGFPSVFMALDNGRPLIGTRLTLTLTAPVNAAPLTAVSISQAPRSGQQMSG